MAMLTLSRLYIYKYVYIKNSSAFRNYDMMTGLWQDERNMTDRGSKINIWYDDTLLSNSSCDIVPLSTGSAWGCTLVSLPSSRWCERWTATTASSTWTKSSVISPRTRMLKVREVLKMQWRVPHIGMTVLKQYNKKSLGRDILSLLNTWIPDPH